MSTKQLEKTTSEKKKEQTNKKQTKQAQKTARKPKQTKRKTTKGKNKKSKRRIFPIWLRIIVIMILAAIALIVGLMIGYGILGDGKVLDALKTGTWQHIIDIVKKEE